MLPQMCMVAFVASTSEAKVLHLLSWLVLNTDAEQCSSVSLVCTSVLVGPYHWYTAVLHCCAALHQC